MQNSKSNLEILMTKKGQKLWRMKRHRPYFWGRVTWKIVTCQLFLGSLQNFRK